MAFKSVEQVLQQKQARIQAARKEAAEKGITVTEALAKQPGSTMPSYLVEQAKEQRQAAKEAQILQKYQERHTAAAQLAAESGITKEEAINKLGGTLPAYVVEQAKAKAPTIEVGKYTDSPQRIMKTPEIEKLKQDQPQLYSILEKRGVEAYKKAVAAENFVRQQEAKRVKAEQIRIERETTLLPDNNRIANTDLARVKTNNPEMYKLLTTQGFDAANKYADQQEKEYQAYTAQVQKQDAAIAKLEPYKDKEGNYDITRYFQDRTGLIQTEKEKVLLAAGFNAEDVKEAKYNANLNVVQRTWQGITPWQESKGEKATPKGAAIMAAEMIVPGVYTVGHWKDLTPGERAAQIAIDVVTTALIVAPIVAAAGAGARTVATAGRAARIAGAAKGVGSAALAQLKAPVDMVIHPVGTAKTTLREIRSLAETIAHPKKLPEAVITTSEGTVRLKVTQATTPTEAMAIRDKLMQLAAKGERPVVKVGNQTVELSQSPLMKAAGGGVAHTTPSGEAFEQGLRVTTKEGMALSEQGLFVSHEPLPRFTEASAFGKPGEKPAIIITSKETAAKAIPTGKVYRGTAEMELRFPVGSEIPEAQQHLFTRVGVNSTKVEIMLEKPLTASQIARLKAQGLIETIKAPFKPAITIKGKGRVTGLTMAETKKLAKVLKQAGNADQAENLLRAARITRASRVAAPTLARITGRVSRAAVNRELARLPGVELSRVRPERLRLEYVRAPQLRITATRGRTPRIRVERISPRVMRAKRTERAERPTRAERIEREERGPARDPRTGRFVRAERVTRITTRQEPLRTIPERPITPRATPVRVTPLRVIPGKGKDKVSVGAGGKEEEWTPEEIKSAIAWRDGFVVHAIKSPYRRGIDEQSYHIDKAPKGLAITNLRGSGSQQASARVTGRFPSRLTVDVGNQDLVITRGPHNRVRMSFHRDIRHTRSQTTIKRGGFGHNISKRHGRIFHTKMAGGTVMSRRPMRGF